MRETERGIFRNMELIFWPFVLVVGKKICNVDSSTKIKFWRDHAIMCFVVVGPVTILESFSLRLPLITYFLLVGGGFGAYMMFILKWRKHLSEIKQ